MDNVLSLGHPVQSALEVLYTGPVWEFEDIFPNNSSGGKGLILCKRALYCNFLNLSLNAFPEKRGVDC